MADTMFGFLGFPMGFQRDDAFALDRSSLFFSYDDAVEYAKGLYQGEGDTSAVAHDSRKLASTSYVGQIISVLTEVDGAVTAVDIYKIDADRSLQPIGSGAGAASKEPLPSAPGTSDTDYELGTIWVTEAGGVYVLTDLTEEGTAVWTAMATADQIANLGGGDMLQATYDDNKDGIVNAADKLGTARKIAVSGAFTGEATFDGSSDVEIILSETEALATQMTAWSAAAEFSESCNKEELQKIQVGDVEKWNAAEANVIEVFKVNGTEQSIVDKAIDITVPTKPEDIGAAAEEHNHDDVYVQQTVLFDEQGIILASKLPGFVDDVIEVENFAALPSPVGETGKIYVTLDDNKTYRWSGTQYTGIGNDLALGNTAATAFRGDFGQIAYDHSQEAHAPADAQANVIEVFKVNGVALEITDKSVNLPIATTETLGLSKSSTEAGKVSVAEDGTMSVNSLDVSKLYIAEGDELVLDGGAA